MRLAMLVVGLLLLAGCAAQATPAPVQQAPAGPPYHNPILDQDFPDPDLLKVGDTWYAYATNATGPSIQVASSIDLVTWVLGVDALPAMPVWARAGLTWAPEVTTLDGGKTFLMYYVARDIASNRQCIGLATARTPLGPFVDLRTAPFICHAEEGGDIDASSFVDDDGAAWLLWKNDGNCCGMDTWISIQPLAPDGLSLVGEPTRLIKQDLPWEGNLVEAPTLWKQMAATIFSTRPAVTPTIATQLATPWPMRPPASSPRTPIASPIPAKRMGLSPAPVGRMWWLAPAGAPTSSTTRGPTPWAIDA